MIGGNAGTWETGEKGLRLPVGEPSKEALAWAISWWASKYLGERTPHEIAKLLDAFAAARVAEALVDAFDDESVTTADAGRSFMSRLAVKIVDLQAEARAQERERAIRAVKNACWREEITAKAASVILSALAEPQEGDR